MRSKIGVLLCLTCLLIAVLCSNVVADKICFCGVEVDLLAESIDFGEHPVTDIPMLMSLLDQMPNLNRVDMYESTLTREEMDSLFDGYPHIFFGWTLSIDGMHELRTDATAFSTLHGKCKHKDDAFYVLRYCRNLVALDLGHNYIKDIGFLSNFPQMKVLILACNQIQDISVLSELKDLEYLELFTNRITDFSPLVHLGNLKDLNISNNPVTDISVLSEMKSLERFWCTMNEKVYGKQRRLMQETHPECTFFWEGQPTRGGWREHERYDIMHEVFINGEYRPFND